MKRRPPRSTLDRSSAASDVYKRQDFKRHGFDLESTHLRHFLRLSRLTLFVALLYLWCVAFGTTIIKRGLRYWVDRSDRRDLSVFRIGHDMIERFLTNGKPLTIRLLTYLEKVYG